MLKNIFSEEETIYGVGVFYNEKGEIIYVNEIVTSVPHAKLAPGEEISFQVYATRKEEHVEGYRIIPSAWG